MKILIGLLAAIFIAAQCPAQAPDNGLELKFGYKSAVVEGTTFSHDTHPDDSFLPNSNVPGSAGTTSLDDGMLHFGTLGLGYHAPLMNERLSWNVDVGGMLGGDSDRRKNANDSRPDGNAAFVYSQARWGIYTEAGLAYHVKRFYFGANAQLVGIFVSSGWDRFGRQESEHVNLKLTPSAGPKVGYYFDEDRDIGVEGTVQLGEDVTFGVQLVWQFF